MTEQPTLLKKPCGTCGGTGEVYDETVYQFFVWWRKKLGFTQRQVVTDLGIDEQKLRQLENGWQTWSQYEMNLLASYYSQHDVVEVAND